MLTSVDIRQETKKGNRDPLWRDVSLEHRASFPVFGIEVVVESNSPAVPAQARDLFSAHARHGAVPGGAIVVVRIVAEPSSNDTLELQPPQWRMPDADHMLVRAPGLVASLDLGLATSITYFEEPLMRDAAQFGQTVLVPPILMLLNRCDRHPVHAAAIRRGSVGLLLHGPSGAGKSTTCIAASRAGLEVLSDDAIRVQRMPSLRVWGMPGHVHLLPDAAARFDVTRDAQLAHRLANGKLKHVVPVPASAHPPFVDHVGVVLLERAEGPLTCRPASAEEIIDTIMNASESTFDGYPEGRLPAAEAIAATGGWKIRLSSDPSETVALLVELLGEVEARAH
jgi:hypothetical protein